MAKDLKIALLLDFYGPLLTDKQREVVSLYYEEDLSLAEIAEHAGITRQGVRDCIKRAEFQLLDCEQKLGHVSRFVEIQQGLGEIIECAQSLEQSQPPVQLRENVRQIIHIAQSINP